MNLLNNKKIAILGIGLENLALVRYLLKHRIKCEITICDARKNFVRAGRDLSVQDLSVQDLSVQDLSVQDLSVQNATANRNLPIHWQLGKNCDKNLDKFDVLFRSPGWPVESVISTPSLSEGEKSLKDESGKYKRFLPRIKCGVEMTKLSSPMKLFFELCPTKNIIGVTGTKGKGTTASLIYEILKAAGKRVWLGGNIGVAPFEFIDKVKKNDWVVLELSSFQLEDMTVSPRIAVITNFYPEHLAPADPDNPNYHKTLAEYWLAKMNIAKWQSKNDYLILNLKLKTQKSNLKLKTQKLFFKKLELPSRLIGEHNKENVAAAVEAAKIVGVKSEVIKKAVANFKGLEHRLELAREYKGVKYYDDSFATTPEAAIIALKSFSRPVIVLLGGADKGADFSQLAKEVHPVKSSAKADGRGAAFNRVKFVVLLKGKATPRIKKELFKAGFLKNKIKLFNNINEAVRFAKEIAIRGDVVLLSTACASFGMFKNYKERGKLFKATVESLK